MNWTSRVKISWILIVLVIIGSLLGANHIMHNGNNREPQEKREPRAGGQRQSAGVFAGIYVPENDPQPLFPYVKGQVKEVLVKTDDAVKKGQVLLIMDKTPAQKKLAEAEAAVAQAEAKVEKARQGFKQFESARKAQLTAIEAAKSQNVAAQKKADLKKQLWESHLQANGEAEYLAAKAEADAARLAVQAQEEKLESVEAMKPNAEMKEAEAGVRYYIALLDAAKYYLDSCELKAPADGTIMRSMVSTGDMFGEQFVKPAFLFYTGKLVVKAKINQEWASRVKMDQPATIKDPNSGQTWKGKVTYVAKSFQPDRDPNGGLEGMNLLQPAAELVLECRITLDPDQSAPPPLLNQKVSVTLGQ